MNFYYTDHAGSVAGPVTRDRLKHLVDAEILPPTTQVCCEGSEDWQPISTYIKRTTKSAAVPQTKTRNSFPLVAVAVFLVVCVGAAVWWFALRSPVGDLDGQVFIATRGGQNFKLGQVKIMVFRLEDAGKWLKGKADVVDAESKRLKDSKNIEDMKAYLHLFEGSFYFEDLPNPMVTTFTDADGKFSVKLPRNKQFVIAAQTRRSVGADEEKYYWMLKISLDGLPQKTLMLSNNNQTSSISPDSFVITNERFTE